MNYFVRFDDGRWLKGYEYTSENPGYGYGDMEQALKSVNDFRFLLAIFNSDSRYRNMGYSLIPESDIPYWTSGKAVNRHGEWIVAA